MESILLKDYPYEVFADGTVYRTERKSKNGRNLKRLRIYPYKATNGYWVVKLYCPKEDCYKKIYLHRLLYSCFVGSVTGLEVDHIDGDRSNAALSNLRAVTHKENTNNPRSIERYKAANALSKNKFNRDKMTEAKSQDYYNKLVRTYKRLVKKHGYCGIMMLMKVGHCGYPRAKKLIAEMEAKSAINQRYTNN